MLLKSVRTRIAGRRPRAAAAGLRHQPAEAAAPVTGGQRTSKASARSPGRFTGCGFDTCQAPDQATMNVLRRESPFWGVGIYIGGEERSCAQPNLTATWVQTQRARAGSSSRSGSGRSPHCADADLRHQDLADQLRLRQRRASGQPTVPRATATSTGLRQGQHPVPRHRGLRQHQSTAATSRSSTTCPAGTRGCRALGWKGGAVRRRRDRDQRPRQHQGDRIPTAYMLPDRGLDRPRRRRGRTRARSTSATASTGTSG